MNKSISFDSEIFFLLFWAHADSQLSFDTVFVKLKELLLKYPGFQRILFSYRYLWLAAKPRQEGAKRRGEKNNVSAGVDKTRNMEHPGTSRNMKKLKYFFYEKMIN